MMIAGHFAAAQGLGRDGTQLPELHFRDLRRTGSTLASRTGASLRDLIARMGHDNKHAHLVVPGWRGELIAPTSATYICPSRDLCRLADLLDAAHVLRA